MASYNSEKSLKMRTLDIKIFKLFNFNNLNCYFWIHVKINKKELKNFKLYFYYLIFKFKCK